MPANTQAPAAGLFVGLISGTSADGIDAALVRFDSAQHCELVLGRTYPWQDALRARLVALGQGGDAQSLEELGTLDVQIADAFAEAALALLDEAGAGAADVNAIGSHGQTVRHRPEGAFYDGRHPFTWQLGDGHRIAERCGIATVADFRRRDVAAGGHGAPLVPAFHAAQLRAADEDRAVLNLGGIANYTLLPASGAVRGFDTGPANCLMDAWHLLHRGGAYDADGEFAAQGESDPELLARLLDEPWFALPPPKSTGREHFHLDWVRSRLSGDERVEDVQATLLELSAITIADALRAQQPGTRRVLACGGGVRNAQLLGAIAAQLPDVVLESTAAYGLDPDFVEAMAFAWLARQTLAGLPGNLPSVTGARGPRVLGVVYPA
ncbi:MULTISPECIES: anhydro-N-acetylmuramic acid kinase [unclassified Lysobacter]|uniref:anhydro-N-acetylmuramic acid kinase n=1 Tax=unclassified Lysobacter TaxID=2635362 RepID=UPI0006FBF809|nr:MULTISPECIES: anhydro-N-acetylmuramic acid kinase [unclassified Lysobacter]KRC31156.1 anhydro-N-acetylmuramic acid kinase [Lysobacter sp. Root76]KRD65648.1 anhydro-N-acetylmuramic acid kinase [Lysobacter sp. Root96]